MSTPTTSGQSLMNHADESSPDQPNPFPFCNSTLILSNISTKIYQEQINSLPNKDHHISNFNFKLTIGKSLPTSWDNFMDPYTVFPWSFIHHCFKVEYLNTTSMSQYINSTILKVHCSSTQSQKQLRETLRITSVIGNFVWDTKSSKHQSFIQININCHSSLALSIPKKKCRILRLISKNDIFYFLDVLCNKSFEY